MAHPEPGDTYDHHRGTDPLLRPGGWRAKTAFLLVNLAIFAGTCALWRYLTTGQWLPESWQAFVGALQTPLDSTFRHPADLFASPYMLLIFGLLLAVLVVVPILISVLYRLVYAVPFAVVVLVIASAPALAVAVTAGCLLASHTKLRSDMPFLAAILGLMPVGGYLVLVGFLSTDSAAMLPLQRWVFFGPLLICFVAAVIASGLALGLVKLIRFRPGGIGPVAAALLVAPVVLFYVHVGPDAIEYARIIRPLAPGDTMFESFALEPFSRRLDTHGLTESNRLTKVRTAVEQDLDRRRRALDEACETFLERFPDSPRCPEILWVRAQCRSLRLSERAYARGLAQYSAARPADGSRELWEQLAKRHDGTPHAALAKWRLGELALREQKVREAFDRLEAAAEGLEGYDQTVRIASQGPVASVFARRQDVPTRGYLAEALFQVRRLLWLIEENDLMDDPASAEAMGALLQLDPDAPDYRKKIAELLSPESGKNYERTNVGDNLRLAEAMAEKDDTLLGLKLIEIAREHNDAAIEANFYLGHLVSRDAALSDPTIRLVIENAEIRKSAEYFREVCDGPPSPWTQKAQQRLAETNARARPDR